MATILLLESNPLLADQYTQAISSNGHEILWSKDAQSAINLADNRQPDIVIMELLLAGHSGIEFLYEFRSYADWQHVPVLILTSLPREELAVEDSVLGNLGVLDYFYKPNTSLARLTDKLYQYIALNIEKEA